MPTLAIDAIVIGKRVRRDLGDIEALAESIRTVGLLHPPVVDGEDHLVCGFRRLQAMKRLGWTETPVTFAKDASDELAALIAERDENTCRSDFTPEEMVNVARQIRGIEEKAARARLAEAGRKSAPGRPAETSEESSEVSVPPRLRSSGETRERVAKAVGVSHPTLAKAEKVIEAAESDPDPIVRQVAEKARTQMNETRRVEPAYRAVEQARDRVKQSVADAEEARLLDQTLAERGIQRVTDPAEIAATRLKHQTLGAFGGAVDGLARMAIQYPPDVIRNYHTNIVWPDYRELAIKAIEYLKECL